MKMAKTQHGVVLTGFTMNNAVAKLGKDVVKFCNDTKTITVMNITDNVAVLCTKKGTYNLEKHPMANRYQGTANGSKVHFTRKKITGKLIYWA